MVEIAYKIESERTYVGADGIYVRVLSVQSHWWLVARYHDSVGWVLDSLASGGDTIAAIEHSPKIESPQLLSMLDTERERFLHENPVDPVENQDLWDLFNSATEALDGMRDILTTAYKKHTEKKPWCTCGTKTPQGAYHKVGCPAREAVA